MDDDSIVKYGHSSRVDEDAIRQYKWTDDKVDSDAYLYANVINFKRSANPRGHAHHCVMCGDKRAAIPSQNKDVCKSCDSGYWLVEAIQILVKFCKGCKNFTKLHDFRDKPEATKCIKCRQRGRQNYFAKKGRVDVLPSPHPRGTTQTKHLASHQHNHHGINDGMSAQGGRFASQYDMYGETDEALAPRVTSSRQKDMHKNRMNKFQERNIGPNGHGAGGRYVNKAQANAAQEHQFPDYYTMMGTGRRDRSNSVNSLLHGYNELPLDFLPGNVMNDGTDDYGLRVNEDDDGEGGGRSRSNTLLSVGSGWGLDDKPGRKDSIGGVSLRNPAGRPGGGRKRVGSEEWGNLSNPNAGGGQYTLVTQDMFRDMATDGNAGPVMNGVSIPLGGIGAGITGATDGVASQRAGAQQRQGGGGADGPPSDMQLPPRKRRVSIDLSNYFSGGGSAGGTGGAEDGVAGEGGAGGETFETKRARNNSISEILSSII